jgi:hypothetical protein
MFIDDGEQFRKFRITVQKAIDDLGGKAFAKLFFAPPSGMPWIGRSP